MSKRSVARTGRTAAPAAADASRDPFELAVRALFWLGLVAGSLVFLPKLFYDGFEAPKLFAAEVTVTLAAGLWLLRAARRGELRLRLPRIALPLAALGLVALLSILWSHNRGLALERLQHLATLIAFLPLAWGLYRRREIRRPLYLILLLGAGIAAWGLALDLAEPLRRSIYPGYFHLQPGSSSRADLYRRLISNQGNPNYLFHILTLTTPAALGALLTELALRRQRSGPRVGSLLLPGLLGLGLLVQLACFFSSQNRSGLLSLLAGLGLFCAVLLLLRRRTVLNFLRSRWRPLALTAGLMVLPVGSFLAFSGPGRDLSARALEFSRGQLVHWQARFASLGNLENLDVYSRVAFLETGARMIHDDPLLGKGIGQFVIHYPGYKSAAHWEAFPLTLPEIRQWSELPMQAHNEFLQLWIELGAMALLAFLAFWLLFARALWRHLRRERGSPWFYLLLGTGAGIFATLVNSLFTFPLQTVASAAFFWSATGLVLAHLARQGAAGELDVRLRLRNGGRRWGGVALALAIVAGGLGGAWRVVRADYLFFDSLKAHARDLDDSIRRLDRAIALAPWRFELEYVQGWLHQLSEHPAEAIGHYQRSIRLAPWFPGSYVWLPELCYRQGDFRAAERYLARLEEFYPGRMLTARHHQLWGLLCLRDPRAPRLEGASLHLRQAGSREALLTLAEAFEQAGRTDSTLAVLKEAAGTITRHDSLEFVVPFRLRLARLALAEGDTAAARESLEAMLQFYWVEAYAGQMQEARRLLGGLGAKAP